MPVASVAPDELLRAELHTIAGNIDIVVTLLILSPLFAPRVLKILAPALDRVVPPVVQAVDFCFELLAGRKFIPERREFLWTMPPPHDRWRFLLLAVLFGFLSLITVYSITAVEHPGRLIPDPSRTAVRKAADSRAGSHESLVGDPDAAPADRRPKTQAPSLRTAPAGASPESPAPAAERPRPAPAGPQVRTTAAAKSTAGAPPSPSRPA